MSAKSGIEWTDATWNPVTGCTKVSQGCKHCYAERDWARMAHLPAYAGRAFTDVACHTDRIGQPLTWKKPRRVFVNSMSDLFHESVPDAFIDKVFAVMAVCPQHTFQVLTKRAIRMVEYVRGLVVRADRLEAAAAKIGFSLCRSGEMLVALPLPNVHLGVSVEDQATANERIHLLLQTPASVRWISAEPLLAPVDLRLMQRAYGFPKHITRDGRAVGMPQGLHWVVAGGESGKGARPMHPDWARSLRDQCAAAGLPFLFKQWGEWAPASDIPPDTRLRADDIGAFFADGSEFSSFNDHPIPGRFVDRMGRIGKAKAGRLLDGVLHDAYPVSTGGAA